MISYSAANIQLIIEFASDIAFFFAIHIARTAGVIPQAVSS
jgi:hypothetical protein